jgi:hypothetical protein
MMNWKGYERKMDVASFEIILSVHFCGGTEEDHERNSA